MCIHIFLLTFLLFLFFFFNDTATTEIYTLSLHDALPIFRERQLDVLGRGEHRQQEKALEDKADAPQPQRTAPGDRKSTRLNSSHSQISYAVFCLKKKKQKKQIYKKD